MPDITFASNYRHGWPSAARYWTSEFDDTCSNFDARLPNLYNTCRRGRRSGLKVREREIHHRNPIQTIVTDSEHAPSSRLKGINVNNLIQVELRNQPVAKEKSKPLAMAVVNCRSLNKNGLKLKDHIVEYNCDIVEHYMSNKFAQSSKYRMILVSLSKSTSQCTRQYFHLLSDI